MGRQDINTSLLKITLRQRISASSVPFSRCYALRSLPRAQGHQTEMQTATEPLHTQILGWLRFCDDEKVHLYQLGCTASTLNVHAQQKRAFNLLWSLDEDRFSFVENTVAIIGGGIAGLTAAAGFLAAGSKKVTVYERTNHLIHLQQGNVTRCLHPNFATWPNIRFRYPVTHLPYMNWRSGAAGEVADQLLWQWRVLHDLCKERIEIITGASVKSVKVQKGQQIAIETKEKKGSGGPYDVVVLALGYGVEAHTFNETPSYWRNDDFSQPTIGTSSHRRFLVSGTGDGGLIEVLRLTLDKFQHQAFIQDIMYDDALLALGQTLKDALSASQQPEQVWRNFLKESLSTAQQSILTKFRTFYREDTQVILNARKSYPSQTDALLLHRICVALLIKDKKIEYISGSLAPQINFNKDKGTFVVNITRGCCNKKRVEVHRLIRRHDAVPDLDSLFNQAPYSREYFRELRRKWRAQDKSANGDITLRDDHLPTFLADDFMRPHFEKQYTVGFWLQDGANGQNLVARLLKNLPKRFLEDLGKPVNHELPIKLEDKRDRFISLQRQRRFLIKFQAWKLQTETWGLRSPHILENEDFLLVTTNSRELLEHLMPDSDDFKYHIFGIYLADDPARYLPAPGELDADVIDCGSRVFLINRKEERCLEIHCDEGMSQAHALLRAPTIFEVFLNKWPTTKVHGMGWAVRNTLNTNQTHSRGSEILQWDPPGYPVRLRDKDGV
jgi:hypothetical protein